MASNRASELTRKLLTFARKNKLNLEYFDGADAIDDVVSLLKRTIDKSITVSCRGKPANAWIYGDTIQLQNAIVNLALNAPKTLFQQILQIPSHTVDGKQA